MSAQVITFPRPRQADAEDEALIALLRGPGAILRRHRKGEPELAEALAHARRHVLRIFKDNKAGDYGGVACGMAMLFCHIEDAIEAGKRPAG
jgi:hypothetical protein